MKARLNARSVVALTSVLALAITGAVAVPAHAARTTVIVEESNTLTSLNSGTPDNNITINSDIAYMTGMSLWHYDNQTNIVPNTVLGSYKITKNKPTDFETTWTINPGRVWSDGTPITAEDLMLGVVLNSSKYSIKAGLGDPNDEKNPPAFNSISYGGTLDNHIVGLPVVSADKMSVTLKFDAPIPNWDLYGPGVSPVHTLVALANGKTSLLSSSEATAAKAAFLKAVTSYDTATLKKYAKVAKGSGMNAKTKAGSFRPVRLGTVLLSPAC